jgi:hypothetical protein
MRGKLLEDGYESAFLDLDLVKVHIGKVLREGLDLVTDLARA